MHLGLFSFSLIAFSVNLYFLGLLWFADKHTKEIRSLLVMGIATCYWTMFDSIAVIAQPYAYGYLYILRSVTLVIAPYSFLFYVLHFTGSHLAHSKALRGAAFTAIGVDVLLLLTNPLHRLVFAQDGFPLPTYGPLFTLHGAVAYVAVAGAVFLLLRYTVREKPPVWFTATWLVSCMVPIVLNVLFTMHIISLEQDVAPFGFALAFMVFAFYCYRSRLNNLHAAALSSVFEIYKDAVVLANARGTLLDCNKTFQEFFPDCRLQLRKNTLADLTAYLLSRVVDAAACTHIDALARLDADFAGGECAVRGADGTRRTLAVSRQGVYTRKGGALGWLIILSDISVYRTMIQEINEQNVRLQELRQLAESASQAKSSFLANMSHEMRTPLNAIIGLGDILLRRDLDADTRDGLTKIYESGRGLLGIINDVLDISKIESGKMDLTPVPYDVADFISKSVNLNMVHMGEKTLALKLWVDPDTPRRLIGDELRMRQILNNLLSNAIKYTLIGEVSLTVVCERLAEGVYLRLIVRDTGIGIRPEDIDSMFSEYRRAGTSVARKIEGTGLGLPICRRLAEMMGGGVTVQSTYGKGSEFTATVLQQVADAEPLGEQTARALGAFRYAAQSSVDARALDHTVLPPARVLVVDDLEINLEVAKGVLEPYGLVVDCVDGGEEAVEKVSVGAPEYDLILMDHMMPGMDGIEAVRVIREEIGTDYARRVPIIALTANALAGNAEMFKSKGFQGFLAKPIDLRKLDALLKRWLVEEKL
ncbi:MAG: response regulator [Oscillospiraceae bacterium]|jgi:signal transduction histidine kinase/CheY-like chemotaxis protein|nr:response regulator [Oscillospiraceae bacterium]